MRNCYNCGYCEESREADGSLRYYCNDLDCETDPSDPICSEENYYA